MPSLRSAIGATTALAARLSDGSHPRRPPRLATRWKGALAEREIVEEMVGRLLERTG